MTMQKSQRTSIDDLAFAGLELSEEHLTLASGSFKSTQGLAATYHSDRLDLEYYTD
jgi:hypothetical protein